ncbi:MAG: ABC transporter ATP-binding protein [Pirellulaceae bacterium]
MIRVENFHKAYAETIAVRGVDFEVQAGRILGMVGPNGAGKTTTLRAICGVTAFARGAIAVAGHDVERQPIAAKQRIGYIPDDPQLFPDLTVEQHLAFIASTYQVADAAEKAAGLCQQFELSAKRNTAARNLSRGMRQKLAICCAYLHDPTALLFDEPLTGLDPRGIRTLKETIRQRAADGAAVIVSSHLLAMVEDICTHVLVLAKGRQRFCGPLSELRTTFAGEQTDASLENIFFHATETPDVETAPAL